MSEETRAFRKTRVGQVVSNKMDKTIVVSIADSVQHKLYMMELKKDLFFLRMQHATNQLDNPGKIAVVKKDIARIKTIIREKQTEI